MKTQQLTDKRGRVLRTRAHRRKMVRQWQALGISQAQYCARHGIHPTTFSTWCRKDQEAIPKTRKRGVEFAEFALPIGGIPPIEVVLPNRVTIRLRDAELCRELLPLLRGDSTC